MSEWRCGPECPFWRGEFCWCVLPWWWNTQAQDNRLEGKTCLWSLGSWQRQETYLRGEAQDGIKKADLFAAAIAARKEKEAKPDA